VDLLALSGSTVDGVLLQGAALLVGVLGLIAVRNAPRLALVVWLVGLCAVPVWAGVRVVVDLEPEVLVTLALLVCLLPLVPGNRALLVSRLTPADGLVAVFVLASLVPVAVGEAAFSDVFVLLAQWTAAFLAGRLLGRRLPLPWVYGAIAVAFTVVAVLALVEYLTGWNPFVHVPGSGTLYDDWSPIQDRGGQARAEGAFGHSIALGASLALAVPLTLAAPFRASLRVAMTVLQVAAAAVTFSRVGLVTAVLGVVLTVVFLRPGLPVRVRAMVTGGLVVVGAGLASWLSGVFSAAGAEATDSAGYRWALLELVPGMVPLGQSPTMYRSPSGERLFGSFHSIDNALILLGLTYGWVPLAVLVVLLLLAVGCVVSGRAGAPTIALVAQLPAFVSVALITQYATFTWFIAGLAVLGQSLPDRRTPVAAPPPGSPAGRNDLVRASPGMVGAPTR